MSIPRRLRSAVVVALVPAALGASACEWNGIESMPLPGGAGHGDGSYSVTIEMPDVTTITRNSPVLANDVEVGSITGISLEGWHAEVTVTLDGDTELPANAVAKIGQTSLLGSSHVELSPPTDTAPVGELRPGATIPLGRAGALPDHRTDTLGAVAGAQRGRSRPGP